MSDWKDLAGTVVKTAGLVAVAVVGLAAYTFASAVGTIGDVLTGDGPMVTPNTQTQTEMTLKIPSQQKDEKTYRLVDDTAELPTKPVVVSEVVQKSGLGWSEEKSSFSYTVTEEGKTVSSSKETVTHEPVQTNHSAKSCFIGDIVSVNEATGLMLQQVERGGATEFIAHDYGKMGLTYEDASQSEGKRMAVLYPSDGKGRMMSAEQKNTLGNLQKLGLCN